MQNIDILLVGNKSQSLSEVEKALAGLPITKHLAASPEEALEMIRHLPLAMVLLDTQITKPNSFEVAKLLDQQHPHLPMLFIIGKNTRLHHNIENLGTCLVDFIFTPLDAGIVKHKILMLMELFVQQQNANKLQMALERTYLALQQERDMQRSMEKKLATYMVDLEATQTQLTQNDAEMERFQQIISYDLQQPIEEILANTKAVIKNQAGLAKGEKQKLKKISSIGTHINEVLSTFREYSGVDKDELIVKNTNLNTVVKDVLDSFKDEIKAKNVKVVIPKPLPSVVCDGVRIGEVFGHLIDNAIRFNDKKKKQITISFSKIKNTKPAEYIFSVKDNGIGIEKDHFTYIFKMFKCLHDDGKYGTGTGVGLAFAEKILARRGGRIWLESELGLGSVFSFTLQKSLLKQRINKRD